MANNPTLTGLFSDIADAIRAKDGTTQSIPATAFPNRIRTMSTGEDLDAEMAAQDNLISQIFDAIDGKVASGAVNLESLTVTPTGETFTVTPDKGVDGFDSVRVAGDDNLTPENIAEGITIYGVEGALKSGGAGAYASLAVTGVAISDVHAGVCTVS